jgi:rod shape determining protein RodA
MSLLDPARTSNGQGPSAGLLRRFHIDGPLLLALLLTISLGLLILYSAAGHSMSRVDSQVSRLAFSVVIMVLVAQVHPLTLRRWTPLMFLLGCILLAVTLSPLGLSGKGAQRWINIGIRFQPSEIMKIIVPMTIAWYLAERRLPPGARDLLVCAAIILIPVFMIYKQPDLGTALLITCAGLFALFLAGLSWRIISGVVVLFGLMAWPIWKFVLHDYQRSRVLTFLNPENDPLGNGYHIIQSKIAVGSGGLFGKGWLNGTQSQLDFLPERHTDFIFAVYSEEFGFLGNMLLLSLFLFIVVRGMLIAIQAQDTWSRLLAGSLSLTFFVYVIVNIGMVTGLLPVVGLPLPLISYGGTSMVTLMAGFGILMSIHTHRKMMSP